MIENGVCQCPAILGLHRLREGGEKRKPSKTQISRAKAWGLTFGEFIYSVFISLRYFLVLFSEVFFCKEKEQINRKEKKLLKMK